MKSKKRGSGSSGGGWDKRWLAGGSLLLSLFIVFGLRGGQGSNSVAIQSEDNLAAIATSTATTTKSSDVAIAKKKAEDEAKAEVAKQADYQAKAAAAKKIADDAAKLETTAQALIKSKIAAEAAAKTAADNAKKALDAQKNDVLINDIIAVASPNGSWSRVTIRGMVIDLNKKFSDITLNKDTLRGYAYKNPGNSYLYVMDKFEVVKPTPAGINSNDPVPFIGKVVNSYKTDSKNIVQFSINSNSADNIPVSVPESDYKLISVGTHVSGRYLRDTKDAISKIIIQDYTFDLETAKKDASAAEALKKATEENTKTQADNEKTLRRAEYLREISKIRASAAKDESNFVTAADAAAIEEVKSGCAGQSTTPDKITKVSPYATCFSASPKRGVAIAKARAEWPIILSSKIGLWEDKLKLIDLPLNVTQCIARGYKQAYDNKVAGRVVEGPALIMENCTKNSESYGNYR
jgi:hypothetical protein